MNDSLLIFVRNLQYGKVKTRIAATLGDGFALALYSRLLTHTAAITSDLSVGKTVLYSDAITETDLWDNKIFKKRVQTGNDLGSRMKHAFEHALQEGSRRVVLIGSDSFDLSANVINSAFEHLRSVDIVI